MPDEARRLSSIDGRPAQHLSLAPHGRGVLARLLERPAADAQRADARVNGSRTATSARRRSRRSHRSSCRTSSSGCGHRCSIATRGRSSADGAAGCSCSQILITATLIGMSELDPESQTYAFVIAATTLATLSASQDIVVDAYNTDLLAPEERAAGSATYVMGYRTAMLMSGSLALVMADHMVWRAVYLSMAAMMAIGVVGTILAEEPAHGRAPRTIASAIVVPFVEFVQRLGLATGGARARVCDHVQVQRRPQGRGRHDLLSRRRLHEDRYRCGHQGRRVSGVGARRCDSVASTSRATACAACSSCSASFRRSRTSVSCGSRMRARAMACSAARSSSKTPRTRWRRRRSSPRGLPFASSAVSATQMALLTSFSGVGQHVFGPVAGVLVEAIGWKGFFVVTVVLFAAGHRARLVR